MDYSPGTDIIQPDSRSGHRDPAVKPYKEGARHRQITRDQPSAIAGVTPEAKGHPLRLISGGGSGRGHLAEVTAGAGMTGL